jgi:HD-GYP domain-containing protein (c-di-GMP phosphodiesterase class II)
MKKKNADTLLRRFSILYVGFAVLPLLFILYLYTLYDDQNAIIEFSRDRFSLFAILISVTALVGYLSMRAALLRFYTFSETVKMSVLEKMDSKVILKLADEEGEIGELAKSFAQIINRLDDNVQELEETKTTLQELMKKVSNVLSSAENFDSLVHLVLETAVDALGVKQGALFSFDNDHYTMRARVGIGDDVTDDRAISSVKLYLDLIAKENRAFVLPVMEKTGQPAGLFTPPLICNSLTHRDKIWGALLLSGKKHGGNFSEDDLGIASNLSNQIAISFENAKLNADVEQTYFETMAALAMAVEARDPYSRGHSDRVGEYAWKIGSGMALPEESIKVLRDASRLHDIGKIGIMDSVLVKPGTLSTDERDIINRHPIIGETILMPLKTFKLLLDPIRHHHENLDGSGYPDGLRGDELNLITRILSVADIYDAMTTDRPYRKAMDFALVRNNFDSLVAQGKIDGSVVSHLYHMIERGDLLRSRD